LSGSSSYTGPTLVSQGILNIQHSNGLGVSSLTTVLSGASLQLQGGISIGALPLSLIGLGSSGAGALHSTSGNNSWAGTVTLVSATTRINSNSDVLTLGGSSSIRSTNIGLVVGGSGEVVVSGAISLGSGTLTKDGVGRSTLAGVNAYSGVTSVNNGTLRLASSSGLGSFSMTTVSNGATVELIGGVSVGNALTLSGAGMSGLGALRSVSGNNSWTGSITINSAATRINSDGDVLDIVGVMSGSGSNGVRYGGFGTVKVSGTSTYTGVSEISTGVTLLLGNSNVLSSSSNVLFSGGKFLSDGKSVSMGTLSVSSASEMVLGTGAHTVRFSAGGTFSFTRLVIKGWEGVYSGSSSAGTAGQFFVGTSAVLTREQLDQIQFVDGNNVSYYAVQLGTGEVVPGVGTLLNPTGNSNIQVTYRATVGGSWTVTGAGLTTLYTFTPSANNANINAGDITNRLRGIGEINTPGTVKIVTTNRVGTQGGSVNFVDNLITSNGYPARYGLQVVAGGDIVVVSMISLTGSSWSNSGNFGYNVDFSAVGNVLLNSSLSTSGQSAGSSSVSVRSNGGNVVLSAGGYVKIGGAITASGGINSGTGGTNSNGGHVSITGVGGVTMTTEITTLGIGGTAGSITINSGNSTVSSGEGTGVNDGQVSGVLQGGDFIKSGAGIFVLKGSNTYSGSTTVSAGVVRLGSNNSIPTTSGLVLAGGEFQSGGFSNTFASIALSANSILRMGSGVHTLTFTTLGTFTAGTTLTIEGWQGTYANPGATGTAGKIVFNAVTSAPILGQLKFKNSGTGNLHTSIRLGTKEIVAGDQ